MKKFIGIKISQEEILMRKNVLKSELYGIFVKLPLRLVKNAIRTDLIERPIEFLGQYGLYSPSMMLTLVRLGTPLAMVGLTIGGIWFFPPPVLVNKIVTVLIYLAVATFIEFNWPREYRGPDTTPEHTYYWNPKELLSLVQDILVALMVATIFHHYAA